MVGYFLKSTNALEYMAPYIEYYVMSVLDVCNKMVRRCCEKRAKVVVPPTLQTMQIKQKSIKEVSQSALHYNWMQVLESQCIPEPAVQSLSSIEGQLSCEEPLLNLETMPTPVASGAEQSLQDSLQSGSELDTLESAVLEKQLEPILESNENKND